VLLRFEDTGEEVPVKIVWARPVSGRGREVSVVGDDKKELAMVGALAKLDASSRRIATEELDRRYLIPRITRVLRIRATFGNRYWHVQTDRGVRRFLMKDPVKDAVWVTRDRLMIRDTLGNRFEIESLSGLDARSRCEIDGTM
jgi:hypothetical protein